MTDLLERSAVVAWLKQEANYARHGQENAKNDTDRLYRMGQKDGLLIAAETIERGCAPNPALAKAETVAQAAIVEMGIQHLRDKVKELEGFLIEVRAYIDLPCARPLRPSRSKLLARIDALTKLEDTAALKARHTQAGDGE